MTQETLLQAAGGGYESTLYRFMNNAALLERFIKKFLQDQTYGELCAAVAKNDHETMLRTAHTLKGIAANLGFITLAQASDALVCAIRNETSDDIQARYEAVKVAYEQVIANIQALDE